MSLGGLTRDSILNLASLVHEDDDDGTEPSEVVDNQVKDEPLMTEEYNETRRIDEAEDIKVEEKESSLGAPSRREKNLNKGKPMAAAGQYSGFAMDYSDYYSADSMVSYVDPYGTSVFDGRQNSKNLFCCLFQPWTQQDVVEDDEKDFAEEHPESEPSAPRTNAIDDDGEEKKGEETEDTEAHPDVSSVASDVSTDTENYGERLTDKDRLAVLARLRLTQQADAANEKGLVDTTTLTTQEKTNGPDGATEKRESTSQDNVSETVKSSEQKLPKKGILKHTTKKLKQTTSVSSSAADDSSGGLDGRRSLFPSYESRGYRSTVGEGSEDSPAKKLQFAPMARVVTVKSRKDMSYIEKSMVWWQRSDYEDFKKTGRIIAKAMLQGGSEIWLTTTSPKTQTQGEEKGSGSGTRDTDGNKWWCKFGHSRRGLEHVASMDEGRQRQLNVNTAIQAVMEEQRRQRMTRNKDGVKLALVAHRYTAWARDLALAAGSADAEAVRANFHVDAKNRNHYLMKQASDHSNSLQRPKFMMVSPVSQDLLDANTSSSIHIRKRLEQNNRGQNDKSTTAAEQKESKMESHPEAIHDALCDESHERIKKSAAGFGLGDEHVDMSAVLTGMGAGSSRSKIGAH